MCPWNTVAISRLPVPGGDSGVWGNILNDYLLKAHNSDGSLRDSSIDGTMLKDGSVTPAKLSTSVPTQAALNAVSAVANAAIPSNNKGTVDGVATLDSTGKVPLAQIPDLSSEYDPAGSASAVQANSVPAARTISAGMGLSGGGDLSVDRTLSVAFGTTAGTAAQGNDSRIAGAAMLVESVNVIAASGSSVVLPDASTATIHSITLTTNCTITSPTSVLGKSLAVVLTQDSTGSRIVTWPSVTWIGTSGSAPILSVGAGK